MTTAMTTATSTLEIPGVPRPGTPSRRPGRALVVVGDEIPGWAVRWCDRSAREIRHRLVPGPADPACAERVGAIMEITADAARRGDPVLVLPVLHRTYASPPRVVAAVRCFPDDAQPLTEAVACAGHMGADLVVAHGLPTSFGERSVGLDRAVQNATRLLDAAVRATSSSVPGLRVRPWLARVRADELVGEPLDADLLVLGGPRPDPWGGLGLVARSALFHAPCAVLMIPRPALSTSGPWSPTFGETTDPIPAAGGRP
ncbi:universal stress protein [Pseudonocardia cypriaca]|uniref:Nucleotide-binding universal stress UspA family protein n=1 Tax=Pseudonocardia cypriaca TaxID=882449 RepID=A0A543FSX3_9PSEU|nr:universal stress protein [Pseudonocardia cypriaca]TQM36911.1 nucleotide-binding universal stress UspA family protein [Pseudonocardia cypriaca]